MALDNNKYITEKLASSNAAAPAEVLSAQTSETKLKQPVLLNVEMKTDSLTELIKSEEFQKLSDEQKIESLKKLYPNATEQELRATLNSVKSSIAAQSDSEIQPLTIDDIIAQLKQKDPSTMTEAEKEMLSYINNENKGSAFSNLQDILKEHGKELDQLVKQVAQNTPNWKKLTPAQKFDIKSDALLSQIVPNYDKLDDGYKAITRESFYNKIGQIIAKDKWDKMDDEDKSIAKTTFAVAVDLAEKSEIPLSKLLENQSKESVTQKAMASLCEQALENLKFDTTSKEWISKTGEEQVSLIIDAAIESLDPDFKTKYSKEKQAQVKAVIIDQFGKRLYPNEWDNLSKNEKNLRLQSLATKLSAVKDCGITLAEFFSKSPKKRLEHIEQYEHEIGKNQPSWQEQIRRDVMKNLNKDEVTDAQIKEYIKKQLKSNELDEKQKIYYRRELKRIELEEQHGIDPSKRIRVDEHETLQYRAKIAYDGDMKKMVEAEILKGQTIEEYRKTHSFEDLQKLVEMGGDLKAQKELCRIFKFSPEEMKILIDKGTIIDFHTKANVEGNLENLNVANQVAHETGNIEIIKVGTDQVKQIHASDVEFNTNYDISLSKIDAKYSVYSAQSNNKYLSEDNALKVSENFARSNEVSDSAKAQYTKAVVESAKTPEMQVRYVQTLSKVENAAVLEGLAAASKSVDKSVQKSYNATVIEAAKSLPPQQQAAVKTAMQTGKISEKTIAADNKDTTVAQQSKPSSQNPTSKTDKTNPKTTTANVNNSSSAATITSHHTNEQNPVTGYNPIQASFITIEQIRNEQLRTNAMENVAQVKAKIDEGIKDWEDKHNTKFTQEQKEAIKIEAAMEAATSAIEDTSEFTQSFKEKIIKELKKATSLGEVYDILVANLGAKVQEKFIDMLATHGSASQIMSFISSRTNATNIIEELYNRCSSKGAKRELLAMLPQDTVMNLLKSGSISDLADVDYNVLLRFIRKNMSYMNSTEFAKYMQYLSLEDRTNLVKAFNKSHNNSTQAQNMREQILPSEQNDFQQNNETLLASNNNNLTEQDNEKNNKSENYNVQNQSQKKFYDKKGNLKAQYVRGTSEYNLANINYDKSLKTAFTLADIEDEEKNDTGINIASGRIPNWKRKGRKPFNHLT